MTINLAATFGEQQEQIATGSTAEPALAYVEQAVARGGVVIGEPAPIIAGTEHWNPYLPGDADGPWGDEFVAGHHVDIRQPSRLKGPLSPPGPPATIANLTPSAMSMLGRAASAPTGQRELFAD